MPAGPSAESNMPKSTMKSAAKNKSPAKKKPAKKEKPVKPKPDYFLIKSEPLSRFEPGFPNHDMKFSIDDLIKENGKEGKSTACWDGVRNYMARNNMRLMKKGDKCLFYHSNAKPSGIVGVVEVVREAYPDHTQFDPKDPHYAPKSKKEDPMWDMVDVKFVRKTKRLIPLEELKNDPMLKNMELNTMARLSVSGVGKKEWDHIINVMEKK